MQRVAQQLGSERRAVAEQEHQRFVQLGWHASTLRARSPQRQPRNSRVRPEMLSALQARNAIVCSKIPIKGTQRQVPRLAGDLENETIRKSDCRPTAEQPKARRYHVGVLKGQLLMIEEHVDRSGDLPGLVTNDEPHEDLRINRAHAVCGDTFEFPPSRRLVASLFEQHAGIPPDALPWS